MSASAPRAPKTMKMPCFAPFSRPQGTTLSALWVVAALSFGSGCNQDDEPPLPNPPVPGTTATGTDTMPVPSDSGAGGQGTMPNPSAPVTNPTAPTASGTGTATVTTGPLPQPDPATCIGIDPEDFGEQRGSLLASATPVARQDCTSPACIGDLAPFWELHDYQPESCGFNKIYGLNTFNQHVTMVVMLTGW